MVRSAVIGAGFIGLTHIEALRRLGSVDVVALADALGAGEKAAALQVPKGYAGYQELIDHEMPDVVHVCTPNETHFEIAMYALERGIHVVCEKPMAMSVEQARIMTETALAKGVVNAICLINRFYPMAYQMKDMVARGDAGRIFSIGGSYLQDWLMYDTDYNWRLESSRGGATRAVADIGYHWMDLMEFVTGHRITEVCADFSTFHKVRRKPLGSVETFSSATWKAENFTEIPIDTEDYAAFLFHTDGGAHGSCVVSQAVAGRKNQLRLSVAGSRCSLLWDSEDTNSLWVGHRNEANQLYAKDPGILTPEACRYASFPGGHLEGYPDTFKQLFKSFYGMVENRIKDGAPAVGASAGHVPGGGESAAVGGVSAIGGGESANGGGVSASVGKATPEGKGVSAGRDAQQTDISDFRAGLRGMILTEKLLESAGGRRWVSV
ncbi:MAG: Gfo/Idh/MocA family oxidoreductase [Lachnospiraceae bacterium]|jgi:predicted dehydrogenase|nr:Gfo/Idh/MocA family oxidoreductase [Lachnospiraceae bacterium]